MFGVITRRQQGGDDVDGQPGDRARAARPTASDRGLISNWPSGQPFEQGSGRGSLQSAAADVSRSVVIAGSDGRCMAVDGQRRVIAISAPSTTIMRVGRRRLAPGSSTPVTRLDSRNSRHCQYVELLEFDVGGQLDQLHQGPASSRPPTVMLFGSQLDVRLPALPYHASTLRSRPVSRALVVYDSAAVRDLRPVPRHRWYTARTTNEIVWWPRWR